MFPKCALNPPFFSLQACEAFMADELASLAEATPLHPELALALLEAATADFEAAFLEDLDGRCIPRYPPQHIDAFN
jgi:hypothetical protein